MSTITLYPSITEIERRLFALPDDLIIRLAIDDPSVPTTIREAAFADHDSREQIDNMRQAIVEDNSLSDEEPLETVELPAFIKSLISQKVAVGQADFGPFPASGQMIQMDQLPTPSGEIADLLIATPLVVLLNIQDKDSKIWHGWLVAPEVQYAGYWDLLLEPNDEPFDPLCGMVQIWNPIQLYLPTDFKARILGQLSPTRMQAVRALASEYLLGDPVLSRSRPGYIAMRATEDGIGIVTGSPLGGNDDPRYVYQQCYHHIADLLNQPVQVWLADTSSSTINRLSALCEAVTAAWQELTGAIAQPVAPIAYAMNAQTDAVRVTIELQQNLHLSLAQTNYGIDLLLTYSGEEPIAVAIIDEGKKARSATLSPNNSKLDYPGLNADVDSRLVITFPDGKQIELPINLDNA